MTRYLTILAMSTVVACSGGKDEGGDTGGDGPPVCANSIASQTPEIDAVGVYYKSDVRVTLADEDSDANITITDPDGVEVSGETEIVGEKLTWTGEDFRPNTTYTVAVDYLCGPATWTITTSEVGEPVGDLDLTGRVYSLDLATGDWLEPANVGSLLAEVIGDTQIFVTPTEVTGNSITMLGGIGSGTAQDLCTPTIGFPAADWTDPFFDLSAPLLNLIVAEIEVNIENLELSGAFAPDGSRVQGTALKGTIDTRALVDLVAEGGEDDAVCVLVSSLGISCEECTSGDGPYCLSVWVDNISAQFLDGTTLVPRTDQDILDDPVCTPPPA